MARYAIALAKNNENGQKCYLSGLLGIIFGVIEPENAD